MRKTLWLPVVVALVSGMPIAACTSSSRTTESTGQYIDSAAITTKVKADLLGDEGLKSFDVSVETVKDVVHLSGAVGSDRLRARAGAVASAVAGVRYVENNLVVR